jgi:magnesium transporter
MPSDPNKESWERIEAAIERGDPQVLSEVMSSLPPGEVARAISRLDEEDQERVLTMLPPEHAADVIAELSEVQAADLIEDMPAETVALIMEEMSSDERADVLGELHSDDAEAILTRMDPAEAADARHLMGYPEDTAGGLMVTEFLAYPDTSTVQDVLNDMRSHAEEYSDYSIQYCYVVGATGKLVGVLRLRDLVLSPARRYVRDVMLAEPLRVRGEASLEELEQFFDRYSFLGAPVVDNEDRLVGIVERSAVEQATEARSHQTFLRFSGIVGGEELRSMALFSRAPRRLSWLCVNILLNVLSASVIALFEGTLQQVIALAVFLPIVSDMSGCSGNQAVAVSIRELVLGLIKPRDFLRVFWKEAQVGILNGLVLGVVLGVVAVLWKGNPWLGLVVGGALAANTLFSVCLGGLVPLLLRRFRLDPALVSSPLLTTFTDMLGFFLVLGFATLLITHLQ